MTGVIKWADPPLQRGGQQPADRTADQWHDATEELRAHPFRWGIIAEFEESGKAQGLAADIFHGRYPSFVPLCEFEAVSRKQRDASRVYARYVGQPS
jgi:hypothetical protein